ATVDLDFWSYDASHGTGRFDAIRDWVRDIDARFILAGGLHPDTVADVLARYHRDAGAVSSGRGAWPAEKTYELLLAFIAAVRVASSNGCYRVVISYLPC